jgi:hypothetical protein
MVRNFILTDEQREEIKTYLEVVQTGRLTRMSAQIRQTRLRAKRLNYNEMVTDLWLLQQLANLTIPKGRISKNLKATLVVKHMAHPELKSKFTVEK